MNTEYTEWQEVEEKAGQGGEGVLGWSLWNEVTSEQGQEEVIQQTRPESREEYFRKRKQC